MEDTHSSASNGAAPGEKHLPEDSLGTKFAEIFEYFVCYLEVKFSRGKLEIRQLFWRAAITFCALLFLSATLLLALGFIFYGTSLALTEIFGARAWLGYLSSGALFLFVALAAMYWQRHQWNKKAVQRKVNAYEEKLARQRAKFGHSLQERATAFSQK